jgi:ATP-dependent Lhr-like helicase
MQFKMKASADEFYRVLHEQAEQPLDPMELVYPGEVPYFDKYDPMVPPELIRKGFAYGVLDVQGMLARIAEWYTGN